MSDKKTLSQKIGENTSIYIQKAAGKSLEAIGYGDMGASTAFNEAAEDAKRYHDLKREKKTELKNKVRELREQCEKWGIPPHEVGL
jgi:hypothetical protein